MNSKQPLVLFIPRFDDVPVEDVPNSRHYTAIFTPQQEHQKKLAAKMIALVDKGWEGERTRYQILPDIVDENGSWPTTTDVHCWWCCFPFDTRPVPLALHYTKRGAFKVIGNFCSFNCSRAYMKSRYNSCNLISCNSFLYKKMTGKNIPVIVPAPPREMLKIFGGPYTIEEFRKASVQLIQYETFAFQCMSVNEHIEETVRQTIESNTDASEGRHQRDLINMNIVSDMNLQDRMQEAKARLDETKRAKGTPKSSTKRPRTPVANTVNKKPANESCGGTEYVMNGMMGLKVIRRS